MSRLQAYLDEYKESHQHPLNIKIHFICVPLIMWSLLGFLHTFSVAEFPASYILALIGVAYYIFLGNQKATLAMSIITAAMIGSFQFVENLRTVCIVVFVVAWIGQFYGHKVEGKKPSFLKDIVFLLIGPVWIIKKILPKLI